MFRRSRGTSPRWTHIADLRKKWAGSATDGFLEGSRPVGARVRTGLTVNEFPSHYDMTDRDTPRTRLFLRLKEIERRIQEMRGAVALLEAEREQIRQELRTSDRGRK